MSKKKRRDLMREAELADEALNIPEDEIWTYRIEGLQAPRIVDKTVKTRTKAIIVVVLIAAISLSIYFSIRAVSNTEFKFAEAQTGWELIKYSNPGGVTEVSVDFVEGDKEKPVTVLHEYAFNCDEKLNTIYVGKDVTQIDGKSFYSCWNLEDVIVDDENPCYRDENGVLYNKDMTEIIYYPSAHNVSLLREAGYTVDFPEDGSITNDDLSAAVALLNDCLKNGKDPAGVTGEDKTKLEKLTKLTGLDDFGKFIEDYNEKAGKYILPETVTSVGKLAFAYSDVQEIYLPEGLKSIGTLGFFKAEKLREIYTYPAGNASAKVKPEGIYRSLPEGLETIGSDAFSYDKGLTYMYIPASVTEIGHHAFFSMAYKSGDEIEGTGEVHAEADEESFRKNTKTGESWLPKIEAGPFKKNVEVIYASERLPVGVDAAIK